MSLALEVIGLDEWRGLNAAAAASLTEQGTPISRQTCLEFRNPINLACNPLPGVKIAQRRLPSKRSLPVPELEGEDECKAEGHVDVSTVRVGP